jgi:hypothetical protein
MPGEPTCETRDPDFASSWVPALRFALAGMISVGTRPLDSTAGLDPYIQSRLLDGIGAAWQTAGVSD